MKKRIGFACKIINHKYQVNGIENDNSLKELNLSTTTVAWLKRQTPAQAEERLWQLTVNNLMVISNKLKWISNLSENLHMFRLGSEILPVYTEKTFSYFYKQKHVQDYLQTEFSKIGEYARSKDIRLSFHPGQFCVLASETPNIVERSIEEFEYHADIARYMGYGKSFQDFKINVHISGRLGPNGVRQAYKKLSPEARNCITLENEENSWGLDDCLSLSDICPTVLDIHHHWIKQGVYIQTDSDQVKRVIDSWKGLRPVMHYSVSREDLLVDFDPDVLPDMEKLLAVGYKKQKLRAHSDFYWNRACNRWAIKFNEYFDIMCESKGKNIASKEFSLTV